MSMTVLLMGFVIGMRHATEPDHLVAMATLFSTGNRPREKVIQGISWGVGHTLTLFIVAGLAFGLGGEGLHHYAPMLEAMVGLVLIYLGLDLVRKVVMRKSALRQLAVGSSGNFANKSLVVGLVHGIAGSSALVVLTAQSAPTVTTGLFYILIFGLGSLVGMAMLSMLLMFPIRQLHASGGTRILRYTQFSIGIVSVLLGVLLLIENLL